MYRKQIDFIKDWFSRKTRKPLIIRGARQVGKTTAVLLAAEELGLELINVNMEDQHAFVAELAANNPMSIFELIALSQGKSSLNPEKTLFFFDFLRYATLRNPIYGLPIF